MIGKLATCLALGALASAVSPGKWTTTLEPKGDSMVKGMANVVTSDSTTAVAHIKIEGAKSGAQLPWHVHTGTCENSGPPVGDASAYSVLTAGSDGVADAKATISVPLSDSGSYSVNVHRSSSDMAVIACGTLAPASPATP